MQMEGCITMGLGYALTEELRFRGGEVQLAVSQADVEIAVIAKMEIADFAKVLVITHLEELKDHFPARIEVEKTPQGSTLKVIA